MSPVSSSMVRCGRAGGGSEGDRVGRDVLVDDGVRSDDHVVSDAHAGEDRAVDADPDVAADLDRLRATCEPTALARLLGVVDGHDDAPGRDHRVITDLDGRGVDERRVGVDEDVVADEDVLPVDEADRLEEVKILADRPEHGAEEGSLLLLALPDAVVDAVERAPRILALLEPTGEFEGEGSGGGHGGVISKRDCVAHLGQHFGLSCERDRSQLFHNGVEE